MPALSCELRRKIFERTRKEKEKKTRLRKLKWDNTHTDRSADCTEARLACVIRVDSSWVHGQPVPSITPASHPGPTCPMCPGSVWSGLLFLESTFILILITNSSAYDLHPSVLAQVWKHLRLTRYNSGLASSLHHETCSASFSFSTWEKHHLSPSLAFLLRFLSSISNCQRFLFCAYSLFILFFYHLFLPSLCFLLRLSLRWKHCSESHWQDNCLPLVSLLNTVMLMLDPLCTFVCFTNIFLATRAS